MVNMLTCARLPSTMRNADLENVNRRFMHYVTSVQIRKKDTMRVRNRKGATELLEANPQYVILNPTEAKGKWHEIFGNNYLFMLK